MQSLAVIGAGDPTIDFTDRPTVKAVITRGDEILILNNGLLPGGGIDDGEDFITALTRELQEELGARVKNVQEIGYVTQFRTFLKKRYLVYGFTAELIDFNLATNPQDEGEAHFTTTWMKRSEAVDLINYSIQGFAHINTKNDSVQGKYYNLLTSLKLIESTSGS